MLTICFFAQWLPFFSQSKKNPQKCDIQELHLLKAEHELHVNKGHNGYFSMLKNAKELNICKAD